jgi:hypothetical protein
VGRVVIDRGGEIAHDTTGVVDDDLGHPTRERVVDTDRRGAGRHGLGDEIVPVDVLTAHSHIEGSLTGSTGVVGDLFDHGIIAGPGDRPAHHVGQHPHGPIALRHQG